LGQITEKLDLNLYFIPGIRKTIFDRPEKELNSKSFVFIL